jgi:hypothetical protein
MKPTCPAAHVEHPAHGEIARCGIQGHVQMAVFEGRVAVCCSDYWECAIWRGEKERVWEHKRAAVAASNVRTDSTGTWEAA